jgi:hypothetical protein
MAFNWDLLVPRRYGNTYVTLRQLEQEMIAGGYHPEYIRRFIGWLHYKNGNVGAGGLSRTEQPDKPGFAPSLEVSFHWAGQEYDDGVTGACAVDTVFKDGPDPGDAHDGIPWTEVPIQGSTEAVVWGLHANVGVPGKGESWHVQPIEIDGHASWVAAGRPAPRRGYPIPPEHDPYTTTTPNPDPIPDPPVTPPITGDDDMSTKTILIDLAHNQPYGIWYLADATTKVWIDNGHVAEQLMYRVMEAMGKPVNYNNPPDALPNSLPLSSGVAIDGHRYSVVQNGNVHLVASFGPIIGPRPAGVDEYGR